MRERKGQEWRIGLVVCPFCEEENRVSSLKKNCDCLLP